MWRLFCVFDLKDMKAWKVGARSSWSPLNFGTHPGMEAKLLLLVASFTFASVRGKGELKPVPETFPITICAAKLIDVGPVRIEAYVKSIAIFEGRLDQPTHVEGGLLVLLCAVSLASRAAV